MQKSSDIQAVEYDHLFKYIIVGESESGKSKIMARFDKNVYDDKYQATIGVEFCTKRVPINNKVFKLQIWDTSGQERYRAITSAYYRGSRACFLTMGFKKDESLETFKVRAQTEITTYIQNIGNSFREEIRVFLVINKAEQMSLLEEEKINLKNELLEYTKNKIKDAKIRTQLHEEVFLVSAKTGEGINELFAKATSKISQELGLSTKVDQTSLAMPFSNDPGHKQTTKQENSNRFTGFFKGLLNVIDGLLGAIVGGVLGVLAAIVVYNPLALLFHYLQKNKLLYAMASPAITIVYGVKNLSKSMEKGWDKGFWGSFIIPINILLKRALKKDDYKDQIATSHIVAAWIITALTAAVVLSIIFPPAAFALILPNMIAAVGLTGFSTAVIAVVAGIATVLFSSAIYGLGYNISSCGSTFHKSAYTVMEDGNQKNRLTTPRDDRDTVAQAALADPIKPIFVVPPATGPATQNKVSVATPGLRVASGS